MILKRGRGSSTSQEATVEGDVCKKEEEVVFHYFPKIILLCVSAFVALYTD